MEYKDELTGKLYEIRDELLCEEHKANCARTEIQFKAGGVFIVYTCTKGYHKFIVKAQEVKN